MTVSEVKCSTCKGAKTIEFERGQRCVPCVTCSGSGVDWRKTCGAAQTELAALREELAKVELKLSQSDFNYDSSIDEMQQRLAAAEQRNSELESRLRHFASCTDVRQVGTLAMDFVASLAKPTESAEDKCTCWRQSQEPQCTDCPNNKPTKSGASE